MFAMLSLHLYVSQQVRCCCGSVALVAAVASAPAATEEEKKDKPAEESDCAFCLPCSLNVLVSRWLYIFKKIHSGHRY